MATHAEVRYWFNGIRTIEVFVTEKQAQDRADRIKQRCSWPIPVSVHFITSSHDSIKEFREMRKRALEEVR